MTHQPCFGVLVGRMERNVTNGTGCDSQVTWRSQPVSGLSVVPAGRRAALGFGAEAHLSSRWPACPASPQRLQVTKLQAKKMNTCRGFARMRQPAGSAGRCCRRSRGIGEARACEQLSRDRSGSAAWWVLQGPRRAPLGTADPPPTPVDEPVPAGSPVNPAPRPGSRWKNGH